MVSYRIRRLSIGLFDTNKQHRIIFTAITINPLTINYLCFQFTSQLLLFGIPHQPKIPNIPKSGLIIGAYN